MSSVANFIPRVFDSIFGPSKEQLAREIDKFAAALRWWDMFYRAMDRTRRLWPSLTEAERASFNKAAELWQQHATDAERILQNLQRAAGIAINRNQLQRSDLPSWFFRRALPDVAGVQGLGIVPVAIGAALIVIAAIFIAGASSLAGAGAMYGWLQAANARGQAQSARAILEELNRANARLSAAGQAPVPVPPGAIPPTAAPGGSSVGTGAAGFGLGAALAAFAALWLFSRKGGR